MSKFYNLIEGQVNNLLRMVMEDDQGQVDWAFWDKYIKPKNVRFIIGLLASLIYLLLLSTLGIYLWNQGIHVMAPGLVQSFGYQQIQQDPNQYYQLLISMFAFMMFF